MANVPPFATVNHFTTDLGIPESHSIGALVLPVTRARERSISNKVTQVIRPLLERPLLGPESVRRSGSSAIGNHIDPRRNHAAGVGQCELVAQESAMLCEKFEGSC